MKNKKKNRVFVNKQNISDFNDLRRNMLRLVRVDEFSDLAEWKDPCDIYSIAEVNCKACNHCRDLDLCNAKHRAIKDGMPVWLCVKCFFAYDNEEIEMRIIDVSNGSLCPMCCKICVVLAAMKSNEKI